MSGSVPNHHVGDVHHFAPGSSGETLLLLHGTGGDELDLVPVGRELAPEANILSPRGPVLEAGMPRFFRRFGPDRFDEDDLRTRTRELVDFVDAAAERYRFDRSRVTALGYSNGANLAAAALLLHGGVLRGAALWRPVFPVTTEVVVPLTGTRVLVASGRLDPYAPPAKVELLVDTLRARGADVDLAWTGSGHALERRDLEVTAAWLEAAGAPDPAPTPNS